MEQITLIANINECTLVGWMLNTGEVNARVLKIEMCDKLRSCDEQFVTFELTDGTVYESKVIDGTADIPMIDKSQCVKIGLYAASIEGGECINRYSPRPANAYVCAGSYKEDSIEPPLPSPSDYSQLLQEINILRKGTIKIITEPCHVAELEPGTYIVKSEPAGEYQGKVVFSNLNQNGIVADYFSLENGLLVVFRNDKSRGNYGEENSVVDFTAQGVMRIPNRFQKNDSLHIFSHTIDSATSVTCYLLKSVNRPENIGDLEANKWYSYLPNFSISDIPATAMVDNITEESTKYELPNAVAVRNYVNEQSVIKTVDKANVWELEAGAYYITESINIAYNPVATHPAFMYKTIYTNGTAGFLFIDINYMVNRTINFYFIADDNLYVGSTMTSTVTILPDNEGEEPIETIVADGSYTSVKAKFVDNITNTSQGIATARGVYNIVKTLESKIPTVPTKVSQLTNDSGYLTEHQSLSEYAKKSEVPTKTSQLENDSNYLTEHQSLSDYAKKSEIPGAVKAAMCDGKGAEWTEDEKAAARARLGIDEILNTFQGDIDEVSALVGGTE